MVKLKVVDLFCGAGGLSEGFRQMGFDIVYALDKWEPAVTTYSKNFPDTEVVKADIRDVDPHTLPKADVVIGGPPCEEFSFAKRGGKGDIKKGLELVFYFLYFVDVIKPRWWVMENVPRLVNFLPRVIDLSSVGFKDGGMLKIPNINILNSADYGAPQRRLRAISGNYPTPKRTHYENPSLIPNGMKYVPMRKVIETLPNPLSRPKEGKVVDPNYGFTIDVEKLTDHFMNTVLTEDEVIRCKKLKENHSWYGKMKFPDDLNKPSRTVMATQFRVSREAIVIEAYHEGRTIYRLPTLREMACFQGFPITFQFFGRSFAEKAHLIGDAVPVHLSSAIAREILIAMGKRPPKKPIIRLDVELVPEVYPKASPIKKFYWIGRKFRDHVPGSKLNGFRVDIDNLGTHPSSHPLFGRPHLKEWVARLHIGSGKKHSCFIPSFEEIEQELRGRLTPAQRKVLEEFINSVHKEFDENLPDATTLQAIWAGHMSGVGYSPYKILEKIAHLTDEYFPEERWGDLRISLPKSIPILAKHGIPMRVLASLLAALIVCKVINEENRWVYKNRDKIFIPEEWKKSPNPSDTSSPVRA